MMPVAENIHTLRLSELGRRISDTIGNTFSNLAFWVIAEISNHSHYALKDHHYFELIEKEDGGILAKMQAVAWRPGALRIKIFEKITGQKFRNGIKLCLRVQVEFHAAFGLKLVVTDVDPSFTLGQLELQRQSTIQRLLNECASFIKQVDDRFITGNNLLQHSPAIQRIAVLSSKSSAGYEDFIHTLEENQFGYKFTLHNFFIAVQGEANAEKICERLEEIKTSAFQFDAVVIIRGGGADTDFILFDQFSLCRSVAGFPIPVITGIGHLKNLSILDLVAHTSTNAPTRAAEFIIAHNRNFETSVILEQQKIIFKTRELLQRHEQLVDRSNAQLVKNSTTVINHHREQQESIKSMILHGAQIHLSNQKHKLTEASTKLCQKPQLLLGMRRFQIDNLSGQLQNLPVKLLASRQKEIEGFETVMRIMNPDNLLKKGFALLYREDQIITSGNSVKPEEKLIVKLQDAELNITVNTKKSNNGEEINL